jgi:hypothetical protein
MGCTAFCTASAPDSAPPFCLCKVIVRYLQVMLLGYRRTVADPRAYHVQGIALGEFCLSGAPAVLEHLRPRLQASRLDDSV